MTPMSGIGGFFFHAEDPELLEQWYHDNFDITVPPEACEDPARRQESGTSIFHAFSKD